MAPELYLAVFAAGLFAGFLNTLAGGGSLVTLPLLIFIGLPSAVANGTNRVGLLLQNCSAVLSFHKRGVSHFKLSILITVPALVGSLIGARLAVDIDDQLFKRILAGVMIVVLVLTLTGVKSTEAMLDQLNQTYSRTRMAMLLIAFFFIGMYGGCIQAGIGFVILLVLTNVARLDLVHSNAIKVFVVLCYTAVALVTFAWSGKVDWVIGGVLASGTVIGAWVAGKFAVAKGNKWIRWILIVAVIVFAIKLVVAD